jgi:DNA-binding transcriptional regulator YiaG
MLGMAKRKPDTLSPKQIKALRMSLDLTQAEAAEKVGVARRTWQDWELGNAAMPLTVVKLLDCLKKLKDS